MTSPNSTSQLSRNESTEPQRSHLYPSTRLSLSIPMSVENHLKLFASLMEVHPSKSDSSRCRYCGNGMLGFEMEEMPCCRAHFHAYCYNFLLEDSKYCYGCGERLKQETVDEIRILSHDREQCAICQEECRCELKMTSCDHWYHVKCLTRWTERHDTCPMCKANIPEDAMDAMKGLRRRNEAVAMHAFMRSRKFRTLSQHLKRFFTEVIRANYPDVDGESDWSVEKVLTLLYKRYGYLQNADIQNLIKAQIRKLHTRYMWECHEPPCLIQRWEIERRERVDARASRLMNRSMEHLNDPIILRIRNVDSGIEIDFL